MPEKLLIVDDEVELLLSCQRILKGLDLEILTAGCGEEAVSIVKAEKPGIILTDLRMPKLDGHALTTSALGIDKEILVIVMTGHGTVETAVQTIKQGAFDFITKPFSADQLRVTITRAMEKRCLVSQNKSLRSQLSAWYSIDRIVGQSPKLLRVFELIKKVAPSDASVLVLGESGTGKELVARSIHAQSRRAGKPFVPIDCASLPENLLESELFGYEKGAFTGAVQTKPGLLESAEGGTVFLDEVGELPLGIQAKFLRVLQERTFRRIGGSREISVDIRVVAATNRNLRGLVLDKVFREDLFYRLNVISLELPPLRERTGDVALIAQAFVAQLGSAKGLTGLSPEASGALELYAWPGNVRELRNAMERASALAEGDTIQVEDLPPEVLGINLTEMTVGQAAPSYAGMGFSAAKETVIDGFEQEYLRQLLVRHGDNMTKAAVEAGIDRKTLYRLLKKHSLTR